MLENGDVSGVIYVGEKITLSVKKEGINQTIIKSFLDCYKANESIVTETAEKNPEKVSDVVAAMTAEINCNAEKNLSGKNTDTAVQYFYNLMAMACLFASLSGITLAIKNQGNLSDVGARKCVSCADKLKSAAAGLAAAVLVNFVCNAIGLAYLLYVLRINFGAAALPLFGITFVGSLTGVAIGFLVGSVGTASENVKTVVLVSVIMLCCFFSGLMAYNMRMVVDKYAPWFNRINPAALISDSFYSLNIYSTYERLLRNLITLAVIAAVCLIGGFLAVRRKKYASL
jgi:ABC-2 type transport system permease protein